MIKSIIAITFVSLLLGACTAQDQQRTEEIFKPETERLDKLGDSAQVQIEKIGDSAKVRFNRIADSAGAAFNRIADSSKVRARRLRDSVADESVDRVGSRIKDLIRGRRADSLPR